MLFLSLHYLLAGEGGSILNWMTVTQDIRNQSSFLITDFNALGEKNNSTCLDDRYYKITTKIFDGNLAVALDRQVQDAYSTVPLSQPLHQVSGAPEHHL